MFRNADVSTEGPEEQSVPGVFSTADRTSGGWGQGLHREEGLLGLTPSC